MTEPNIPFAALAEPAARALLGEPNPTLSTRSELRWGSRGSLAVHIAGARAGTWHDHENGDGGGVLALVTRETGRQNGDAVAWLRENGLVEAQPANGERHLIATYSYTNADGRALFQVLRYSPKDFRQRRPDGNGGWEWSLRGVERALYRLPEILRAAPAATIFVTEGEKDADALAERRLVATTAPGGAGKWLASYNETLRNRHVAVLPDNDAAGEAHAAAVAKALHGIAASVKVLRLPDLPLKGDVSDWLAAGGTADELQALADNAPEWAPEPDPAPDAGTTLRDFLGITAWAQRPILPPDRLLGDLVTTTTRTFIVGRTGLGKTLLGLGMAVGMAAGTGFVHWRSHRPARVLVLDGEMPQELIRARAIDALRRAGTAPPPGNLTIYARDGEEDFAKRFPSLGTMPPLNTEAGQNWTLALLDDLGGADVVVFDNVMSLLQGVQKEEEAWAGVLPLVQTLTARRVGQVWLDHTGHAADRQYGSSTKAWRFDSVGILTAPTDDKPARDETAFKLSFEHPGKARRRTPDNAADFEAVLIRLAADRWTSEPTERTARPVRLSPAARAWLDALADALAIATPPGSTSRGAWYAEGCRVGLAEPLAATDDYRARDAKQRTFRKYLAELRGARLIGVNGDAVCRLG